MKPAGSGVQNRRSISECVCPHGVGVRVTPDRAGRRNRRENWEPAGISTAVGLYP